ncbi:MAG: DUF1249 domain-containing protein [Methylococcales bacterium]
MNQLNPINKSFCLHQLFESNYLKLLRLIPQLHCIHSSSITAQLHNKPVLKLIVIEKTTYTLTVQLVFCSDNGETELIDTDASLNIRIYLDIKSAEVMTTPTNLLSISGNNYPQAALDAKWPDNYLLDKWLSYCLSQGYELQETSHSQPIPA